jgi:DNA-binding NtrC family response regulator
LLLDHNEWNVSRVARVLGVTRMTIYNRLRRFAIQRQRVPKHGSPAQRRPREVVSHA